MKMNKRGYVYYKNALAGTVTDTDAGYEFSYNKAYIANGGLPISLTLPIREATYFSKTLFPFFDGLIPEGWLLDVATDYWKVKSTDRFQLLLFTCSDAIGAVSILPELKND